MDLRYGPEYEEFRAEVAAFLEGWPLVGPEAEREERFIFDADKPGETHRVCYAAEAAGQRAALGSLTVPVCRLDTTAISLRLGLVKFIFKFLKNTNCLFM